MRVTAPITVPPRLGLRVRVPSHKFALTKHLGQGLGSRVRVKGDLSVRGVITSRMELPKYSNAYLTTEVMILHSTLPGSPGDGGGG